MKTMQTVMNGYRGLSFLVGLNWDWLVMLAAILGGLLSGAFVGALLTATP
ncbi:hypothetical protein GCM10011452_02720 [Gemmobacter lanyuensis]|uniref:Uncharacterized protein n=1 Tax=Gemmobacter lanyuensis TaxID=1054497 RepID=A0A918MGU8_9RHOB|nr:hypothetical protein [Gemmobacter lanyuensis]GGW21575.1 hypothetical protein GCM10011452_02720 [Gemmobacter lanyuensis]